MICCGIYIKHIYAVFFTLSFPNNDAPPNYTKWTEENDGRSKTKGAEYAKMTDIERLYSTLTYAYTEADT